MKLDANWKVKTYTYKKCLIGRKVMNNVDEAGRQKKFPDFLKSKRRAKVEDHENIVSAYSKFKIQWTLSISNS